jgi:NADH:ubiquinone oxidoreductase subunit 5 (subunit L)/multisubunit Na+/H+ antiporter MnhA subunit
MAKVVGVTFLGRPRSAASANAVEVAASMRIAQWLLAILCIVFGLAAPVVLSLIKPVCLSAKTGGLPNCPIPMAIFAVGVGGLTVFLYLFWLNSDKSSIKQSNTWNSGLEDLTGRMQISSAGFSENVANTFAPLFRYHLDSTIEGQGPFPESISVSGVIDSERESSRYGLIWRLIAWLGKRMLLIQSGSVHLYLFYMLIAGCSHDATCRIRQAIASCLLFVSASVPVGWVASQD